YVGVMVVTITFYDASTSMDFRTLVLVFVCAVVLGPRLVASVVRSPAFKRHERAILGGLAAILVASYPLRAAAWAWNAHTDGIGWNAAIFQESAVLKRVESLRDGLQIVTNGGALVAIVADRPWKELPRKYAAMTQLPNSRYPAEL